MGIYKSTIKATSFLYLEMKKASELKLKGLSNQEIIEKIKEENYFLLGSDNRKRVIASEVIKRMDYLNQDLLEKLVNRHTSMGKIIVLYAIMKKDRLFSEFMQEVFRDKLLISENQITAKDFNLFFQRKREQDADLERWADETYKKLTQVYKRILTETGLAKRINKSIEIQSAIIDFELQESIKALGDEEYLKILQGVRE